MTNQLPRLPYGMHTSRARRRRARRALAVVASPMTDDEGNRLGSRGGTSLPRRRRPHPVTPRRLGRKGVAGDPWGGDARFHTSPYDRDKERARGRMAKASRRRNRRT